MTLDHSRRGQHIDVENCAHLAFVIGPEIVHFQKCVVLLFGEDVREPENLS